MMGTQAAPEVRQHIRTGAAQRANTPHGLEDHMYFLAREPEGARPWPWVVDRLVPPQFVARFVEFCLLGTLPSGRRTALPVFTLAGADDLNLISEAYSAWAPPPFAAAAAAESCVHQVMGHIGSDADGGRMHVVSHPLYAAKSRVWEGIVPLSARRWAERGLDERENFGQACQVLSAVVRVFHYLNHDQVRRDLRVTYNLIEGRLRVFEKALNQVRAAKGAGEVNVAELWEEFVRDHYGVVVDRAHGWVIERVERLRGPVLEALGRHQPGNEGTVDSLDGEQWALTNMVHDLAEIASHADRAIFLPMDGYNGHARHADKLPRAEHATAKEQATGMHPISFTPDPEARGERYAARVKALTRKVIFDEMMEFAMLKAAGRAAEREPDLVYTSKAQIRAREMAARELRGEPPVWDGKESWVTRFELLAEHDPTWGFVVYRVTGEEDAAWEEFRTKFESDVANWGEGMQGVKAIKEMPVLHWVDAREHGLTGDVEGLKK